MKYLKSVWPHFMFWNCSQQHFFYRNGNGSIVMFDQFINLTELAGLENVIFIIELIKAKVVYVNNCIEGVFRLYF